MMTTGDERCLKKSGFTLLEITIAMIVIGILAGLAVPYYVKVVERSKKAEAYSVISMVKAGYKARLFANETTDPGLWNPSGCDNGGPSDQSWAGLGMTNPDCDPSKLFLYDVWDAGFSAVYAPVNAPRNVIIAVRKRYPGCTDLWDCGLNYGSDKWIYMDLDTGEPFASDYYK